MTGPIIERRPDGRPVGDTQALAALTNRPPAAVRRHCPRDPHGRYDIALCTTALAERPDDPILLTATEATTYLRIPAGTVYSWVSRGLLAPLDRTEAGRPRYAADDLTRLQEKP